jgi:8-amino-7-oxononanoate synthase
MADLFDRFEPLLNRKNDLLGDIDPNPFQVEMDKVVSQTEAIVKGKKIILAGTNNYLGLTFAPEALKAAHEALESAGTGTTGSRVANGTYYGHSNLEGELSSFLKKDHAMVFSTGYLANLGVLSTLLGPDDYILMDADCHASIYDGVRMGQAQIIRFKHNDPSDLDKRLSRLSKKKGNKLIVVEGIYSMLGDKAPLKKIVQVKNKYKDVYLLSDEAHSLGVLGRFGRGLPEELGLEDEVDFIIGTFSKSAGTVGGFCASSHPKFNLLRLACRPYIFTASLPPSVVASATVAISLIERGGALRKRLMRNAQRLHSGLSQLGLNIGSDISPVVAVIAPDVNIGVKFWRSLMESGVYVNLALPPATPNNFALLRCSLSASHTNAQIDSIIDIFSKSASSLGLIDPVNSNKVAAG